MNVFAVKTKIITPGALTLTGFLDGFVPKLKENSVVAVSSKLVSICEGNIAAITETDKDELIKREADLYLDKSDSRFGVYLTVKHNLLTPSAGVDESNAGGFYVMWPKDPQRSANLCHGFLKNKFKLQNLGVIVTDSCPSPLKWGVTGKCIAHCGFFAVHSLVGQQDLFGRTLEMTKINVADALAAAAVLCMGESNGQTPLAVIEDPPFAAFTPGPPTEEELKALQIDLEDDLFAPLLKCAEWKSDENKTV